MLIIAHNLYIEFPLGIIPPLNGLIKILGSMVEVLSLNFLCLFLREVFDSLKRFPMVFHQYCLSFFIYKFIGIDPRTLHLSVIGRDTPRGKQKGDHMERFGAVADKVKLSFPALDIRHRIWLESVDEIRKFDRIPYKENL